MVMTDPNLEQRVQQLEKDLVSAKKNLKIDRIDMSFDKIINMYEKFKITVAPDFQILFRWSNCQQTRFIESLLLGFPIPPIFVAEIDNGRWELVDGLQRLSTVFSFFGVLKGKEMEEKNYWTMCKGELVKGLDGFNIGNLPLKYQTAIRSAVCRIEIIRLNESTDMRCEVMNRLNSGGALLTDQEIKNAIFRMVL
jgi:uncharacterized protein with ParB-like and HNH nuclease domain